MPQVSAIIAVYNGAATVAQAIDSVLAQTFGDLDLIVVNDGSTDGTPAVLKSYGDRIRVVDQPNRGVAAARNAGVGAPRGGRTRTQRMDHRRALDIKRAKAVLQ